MPPPRPPQSLPAESPNVWHILTAADKLLVVGVLVCVAALFYHRQGASDAGARVTVRVSGELLGTYSLSEPRLLRCEGPLGVSEVEIANRSVRVVSAPCPQQVCVRTGWIRRSGEVVACLPNRLILQARGAPESAGPDAVTR